MLSVPLALQDFVPVLLTAIGLRLIVRIVGRAEDGARTWAMVGAVLIVAGGLSRATWKLLVAASGTDVTVLFIALYPLLATGYLLFAMALWRVWQAGHGRRARVPVAAPAAIALALLLPVTAVLGPESGRILPLLWLVTATIGSVATSLLLARWARALGRPGLAALFVASLLVTVVLNGLARAEVQTETLQWAEQLVNTLSQGTFALAAAGLGRSSRPDHLNTRNGV